MSTTALYALAAEYRDAATKLADLDLDPQTLADTLESLSGDLEVKATNVAMFIRNMDVSIEAMKAAEKTMSERRKSAERRRDSVKTYLLTNMVGCGIKKIEGPYFTVSVRDNPEAVDVFEPGTIPQAYMREVPPPPPSWEVDKASIKAAIKAGVEVPGAKLTRGQRLEIK
jgi:Siphovirus Gp157